MSIRLKDIQLVNQTHVAERAYTGRADVPGSTTSLLADLPSLPYRRNEDRPATDGVTQSVVLKGAIRTMLGESFSVRKPWWPRAKAIASVESIGRGLAYGMMV